MSLSTKKVPIIIELAPMQGQGEGQAQQEAGKKRKRLGQPWEEGPDLILVRLLS